MVPALLPALLVGTFRCRPNSIAVDAFSVFVILDNFSYFSVWKSPQSFTTRQFKVLNHVRSGSIEEAVEVGSEPSRFVGHHPSKLGKLKLNMNSKNSRSNTTF